MNLMMFPKTTPISIEFNLIPFTNLRIRPRKERD